MLKGVIFDLDGVLTDTSAFHYLCWKRLADELGGARHVELLVEGTADALRLVCAVPNLTELNVALMSGGEGKAMVTPSLGLAPEDFDNLRAILAAGVDARAYVTPDDRQVPMGELL